MLHDVDFTSLLLFGIFLTAQANFDPFMDQTYFSIDWPGPAPGPASPGPRGDAFSEEAEHVMITTANKEKYKCIIPKVIKDGRLKHAKDATYVGPTEMDLLQPLFDQKTCSYRIETYWTYELCHGRFLRQYHEEKDSGEKTKLQEFYLGYYTKERLAKDKEDAKKSQIQDADGPVKRGVQKVRGYDMPYHTVLLTEGTTCELINEPRQVSLMYVCDPGARGEILELKEISTCFYEVVILTNELCGHPLYTPQEDTVNRIECLSLDGAPDKPISLQNHEHEQIEKELEKYESSDPTFSAKFLKETWDNNKEWILNQMQEEERQLRKEDEVKIQEEERSRKGSKPRKQESLTSHGALTASQSTIRAFFNGEQCIQGGTGWWKHEVCYGKRVIQFHEEGHKRTTILLGTWDEVEHLKWINENPNKKVSNDKRIKTVSHFYSNGDLCDETGEKRKAEVKFKCKESTSPSSSVSIFHLEPKTCEYLIVIEAAVLCAVINQASENGLIHDPEFL